MDTPVYIFTGFLEGGKTTFMKRLLANPVFVTGEKTLIILCEEGLEELDRNLLNFSNAIVYIVENEEDLTKELLEKLDKQHEPERVLIEYNCMWEFETIINMDLPKWWVKTQVGAIIDSSTFSLYMNNLRSIMAEQFRKADFVLFNRCDENTNKLGLRGSVKVVNPKAQVIFQLADGEIDNSQDKLPYDIDSEIIEVEEYDFGLWYADIMNNIDKYVGKKIKLMGQAIKSENYKQGFFILKRKAMTCCAEDISELGVLCCSTTSHIPKNKEWIEVIAFINKSDLKRFDTSIPVIMIEDYIRVDKPKDELIYFY